jgi:hypothetical protein
MFFFLQIGLQSQELAISTALKSTQVTVAPKIDGNLDDELWKRSADLDEYFTTYSPVNGDMLPERTRVWVSNDEENIYFAFYCHDSKPDQIKSSFTKHDDIWNDDWIGFMLDPLGNKSYGYVLIANPFGIQGDIFDSPALDSDVSSDFVWYSAGKILNDGYSVEIQMPLKNFTYSSGENVEMNIIFERKVSRLTSYASYPAVPVGQTFFAEMSKIIFPKIENQIKLLAIPSVTYNNSWDRVTPDSWGKGNGITDFGITAKFGLTSSISAEATYNPDFSHIESDAFQVLINQRYPIYYSEKRPFFMETRNIFNISGGNLGGKSLLSVVHTRKIVDPLWGVKISGEYNNWLFGILVSGDEWRRREFNTGINESNPNPFQDKIATYLIGRAKYILSGENHIGVIGTDQEFADGHNRVIGTDLNLRLGEGNHWVRSNFLSSHSKNENTFEKINGVASNLAYNYIEHVVEFRTDYEYIDPNFQMPTAFIQRTGISKWSNMLWLNFYPESESSSLIKKITPQVYVNALKDLITKEPDYIYKGGVNFNFIMQGSLRTEYQGFSEFWSGQRLNGRFFNSYGQVQLTNWLRIQAQLNLGDKIYYSTTEPFVGKGISTDLQLTMQPTDKLSQFFEYQYQNLYRKDNDEKMYDVNIFLSKTTFQINRYLFLRAIIQYDSYRETILVDALAFYELIPGTVLQIGYGSLNKNLYWQNEQWMKNNPLKEYYNTNQSVFIKMSYLFQY